jgi:hypothetical protein
MLSLFQVKTFVFIFLHLSNDYELLCQIQYSYIPGWLNIFSDHFVPIPPLPRINGYTSCHFYLFRNGELSIYSTMSDAHPQYTHNFIQREGSCTPQNIEACKASLMRTVFKDGKTWENATLAGIMVLPVILNNFIRGVRIYDVSVFRCLFRCKLF